MGMHIMNELDQKDLISKKEKKGKKKIYVHQVII